MMELVIIMKSNNYQFSFNLDKNLQPNQNQNQLSQLINDIFPYLKFKTVTFAIFAFSLIPFLIEIYGSTIIPDNNQTSQNLFLVVFAFGCKSIVFLRLGSEYEVKLGLQYFLTLIIMVQLTDFIVVFMIETNVSLFIFRNSSALSVYILSVIDLQKFKEDEIVQFKNEEKPVVENCDLLDLNDTIVKLKSKDSSSFYYQSYTNSQFFSYQSMHDRPKPNPKKMMVRTTIKSSNLSNIIQQPLIDEQEQSFATKIYKIILFHFVVFASTSQSSFILLLINQAMIYAVITTKIIKKLFA